MCPTRLLMTICLLLAPLTAAAQNTAPENRPAKTDLLPAGPFLFEPGATRPTFMEAFHNRPLVKSPDGKAQITITGPQESLKAWVTVQFLGQYLQGLEYRVWPVQASVALLWRPDSQAFALTDDRYGNRSYVLLFGTDFSLGESKPGLGIPITDLTPIVERAFEKGPQEYYADQDFDVRLFYAKVLRWTGNDQLLIGVSALTSGPTTFPGRGLKDWNVAYLVDVPHQSVMREINEEQLLSQYGIKVFKSK